MVIQHDEKYQKNGMPLYYVVEGASAGLVQQLIQLKINDADDKHKYS